MLVSFLDPGKGAAELIAEAKQIKKVRKVRSSQRCAINRKFKFNLDRVLIEIYVNVFVAGN